MTHRRKILYLSIIAILMTGVAFYYSSVSPVNDLTGTKIIDIPTGAGFSQITVILDTLIRGETKVLAVTFQNNGNKR